MAPVRRPMPEASQEAWESRIKRRQSAVQGVKLEPEYKLRFQLALQCGDDLPQTPDPTKRTSKRAWELSFGNWRKALHSWNPEGPPGLRQIDLGRRLSAGVPRRAEAEKPEHDERRARSELQSERTGATWLVDIPQPVRETGNAEQALASVAAEQRQAAGAPAGTAELAAEQPPPTRVPHGLQQQQQQ